LKPRISPISKKELINWTKNSPNSKEALPKPPSILTPLKVPIIIIK
jgi:hypothetical protein